MKSILRNLARLSGERGIQIFSEDDADSISADEARRCQLTEMIITFLNALATDVAMGTLEKQVETMLRLAPDEQTAHDIYIGCHEAIHVKFNIKQNARRTPFIKTVHPHPSPINEDAQFHFYRGRIFQAVSDGAHKHNRADWILLLVEARHYLTDDEINRTIEVAEKRYHWS